MKVLFFLLATLNVALFMWELKQGAFIEPGSSLETHTVVSQEPIVLLSEAAPSTAAPEPTPTVSTAPPTPNPCFIVGPFASQALYHSWHAHVGLTTAESKPFSRTDQIITGYIVYYPAPETADKIQENLKMLKTQGITDLWLFTKGEEAGEIALGSFSKENQATQMKQELLTKGIKAEIKPRYKPKTQWYIGLQGDNQLMENLKRANSAYPQIEIKPIDQCIAH